MTYNRNHWYEKQVRISDSEPQQNILKIKQSEMKKKQIKTKFRMNYNQPIDI